MKQRGGEIETSGIMDQEFNRRGEFREIHIIIVIEISDR